MVESQERPEETVVESAPEAPAAPAPVEQTAPAQAAAAVVEAPPAEQTAPAQAAAAVVEAPPAEQTAPAQAAVAVAEAPPAEQTAPAQAAVAVAEAPPAEQTAPAQAAVAVAEAPPAPQARPPEAQQQPRPAPERPPQPTGREPINMKALLEAGVHFGHQTRRWNPTMKRYIFTQRNGIHIIDLQQTLGMINDAYKDMVELVANGGKVLFVGTKRQAQEVIQSEADRCGMWYVNQRWLGGTLTNFQTIRTRINYMLELQQKRDQGYFRLLPKKEGVKMRDTLNRLEKYFTGMRDMTTLPQAIFAIDIGRENICVAEARRLGIDVFAIVDSDCNPDLVDHIVPGNDDAVRSIRLVTNRMASAVLEGLAQREAALQAEMEEMQSLAADAAGLGEPEGLSEREDAALTDAITLDESTLAELAASMGARVAGGRDTAGDNQ